MERWKINLYTVWFSQVVSLMSFGFGMPFLPFYIQELGVTDPDRIKLYSGILSAAPAITMAVMAPIWGMAADRWGKKLMLLRAMLFASVVIGGMGFATSPQQLVALRFIQGVFTGTIGPPQRWSQPVRRRTAYPSPWAFFRPRPLSGFLWGR